VEVNLILKAYLYFSATEREGKDFFIGCARPARKALTLPTK